MAVLSHEKQIDEYEKTLARLKEQNEKNSLLSPEEISKLEEKLKILKRTVYSKLKPWDRVAICRHPMRPHTLDYIEHLADEFVEIFGDRTFHDDHAIVTGCAVIDGKKFIVVGLEKGKDTESRLYRNFGMAQPEGYRKALRAMELAAKFHLPVITFIDTPGAYPGLTAEERGQGWAIAKNLWEMSRLPTPIIVLLIGEGCSGGALGIGLGDVIGMLEHSYYSVISPEGCASILWKDSSQNEEAAAALKMQAEDLLDLNIIDHIIMEPLGGAHHNPDIVYANVKEFIITQRNKLEKISYTELLERRYQKFRKMGVFLNLSDDNS
ncbi:MAG: acetyl-CoA carboxylase carboxyltransferase subunit alpha [Chlamydiota bacterium]